MQSVQFNQREWPKDFIGCIKIVVFFAHFGLAGGFNALSRDNLIARKSLFHPIGSHPADCLGKEWDQLKSGMLGEDLNRIA